MKKSNQIDGHMTKDYARFELNACNRNEHRDPALAESMRKYGFLKSGAIHVQRTGGGKLKVIRGHHRLQEAVRQGLPVWYIIEDVDVDLFDLEGGTNPTWTVEDWATARTNAGDADCAVVVAFRAKHKLSMTTSASLVGGESAGSHNKQRQIKSGTFRAGDMLHARQVVRVIDAIAEVGVEFARATQFVAALSAAMRVPEFDAELFTSHVRLYPKMMNRRVTKNEYLAEIEAVYNYNAKKRGMPVAYRAAEIARQRSATAAKK
jgi:hypothetical protein